MNNKGFSFVELIIAITLVVLLAFIGLNTNNSYKENTNNTAVNTDLSILNNSILAYSKEQDKLPMPGGNNNFYDNEGQYSHDYESDKTFGVSGFITQNTLPKKYVNYLPIDPKTNQYYAYAKTKAMLSYQVSGVVFKNNIPKSIVLGNYSGENGLFDLVKEYNGPNFIYDQSIENFPYNTDSREITARIYDFTGALTINNSTLTDSGVLDYILRQGDRITTATGSYATIYFSDGTKSILGDETKSSDLILANMKFQGDDNLITKIKLALGGGTIWNNATKLNADGSEFEIYTTDSTAAVRGTIFGVSKSPSISSTNVTIKLGKVDLMKNTITTPISLEKLSNSIVGENTAYVPISTNNTIIVNDGDTPIGTNISNNTDTLDTGTGNIFISSIQSINQANLDKLVLSKNIETKLESFSGSSTTPNINLKLNNTFRKAQYLKIEIGDHNFRMLNNWSNSSSLFINKDTTIYEDLSSSSISNGTTSTYGYYRLEYLIQGNKEITVSFCNRIKNGNEACSSKRVINLDSGDYVATYLGNENKDIPCAPGTNRLSYIDENNGCIKNNLFSSTLFDKDPNAKQWELVGYAPYDKEGDLNIYKQFVSSDMGIIHNIPTTIIPGGNSDINHKPITFSDGGINIGTGNYVQYKDLGPTLGINEAYDFAYEFGVPGSAFSKSNSFLLYQNGFYIKNAFSTSGIIVKKLQFYKYILTNKLLIDGVYTNIPISTDNSIIYKQENNQHKLSLNQNDLGFTGATNNDMRYDLYLGNSYPASSYNWGKINYFKIYRKVK